MNSKKATIYDYARMCKYFDDDCQECPGLGCYNDYWLAEVKEKK